MNSNTKKFQTISGIEMQRRYTPQDLEDFDYKEKLGEPGEYPFTRGINPEMYRENYWVMGQYSGFASAREANQRYRYLIEQGQTGFSVALDLPTQMGYDSDHVMSEGEVGKVGVAIDSLKDVEELFFGIQMEKVRQIRTTANATSLILMAMFVTFAKKNGIEPNNIRFFLQNDVLKEYICRGTYIFPPKPSVKLAVDVIEYCSRHLSNWTPIAVCGYHIRDAGATAVQELAFTFANMICYFDAAAERGLDADSFAPNIFFFLGAQVDLLEEVAKFRAARRIFARLMKEKYGAKNPQTQSLKIFAYTQGGALTAEQPLNNIARVSVETLAAVLGGVQTIATSSYDEAFSIPTEEAVTVALRTQQIIAHETGVTLTVDPLGGSYAIEYLTDKIENQVYKYLQKIETMGGAISCIEKGFFQKELADSAYKFQKSIDSGERVVVGVNKYRDDKTPRIPIFKVNDEIAEEQVRSLEILKKSRSNNLVKKSLDKLYKAAEKNENLGAAIIEAIANYATIGEICDILREVYGTYRPPTVF